MVFPVRDEMFLIILVFLRIYNNILYILKKHLEICFSEVHKASTCLPVFALAQPEVNQGINSV